MKLNYSGEQGQTIRQLMLAHVIYYKAMCLIASPRGKRQQLAIAHEKGKVSLFINHMQLNSFILKIIKIM